MAEKRVRPKTNIIDRIQRDMQRQGFAARSAASRRWLAGMAKDLKPNATRLINNVAPSTKQVPQPRPGMMYFFNYDPKHKETLPYYDRYPLVICVKLLPDGFHGLNLHYLPPMQRAGLLTKLEEVASNTAWNENTKLNISYRLLSSFGKFKEFRPCFKRYLTNHVRSAFLFIPSQSWDISVFLPLARFEKKTAHHIWYKT
jgi:hypothetical protein